MPQIVLKEGTAHLASYTFFTRDIDQFHSFMNHQEHFFHTEHVSLAASVW